MRTLARLVRLILWCTDALAVLSVIGLVALTAMVTIGVVMRYVFNSALTWADEMSSYFLLTLVLLGLAHTLKTGNHIRIAFFVQRLPARMRQYAGLTAYAFGNVFAVLLVLACWARWENFWVRNTISFTDLRLQLYIPATVLLIGSVAFLLIMAAQTVVHLAGMFLPGGGASYGFPGQSHPEDDA